MSILGDGLMGALNVGRGYLQDDIRREADTQKADETAARQEATDIRRDDMAQKRLLVAEQLREEMGIRKDENKRAALQKEGDEIDVETGKIDLKRSSGLINSIRNSVSNEGEFANKELSPEDIETIRTNMSPADAEKLYGIKPRTALSVTDDQIAAAKNVGAFNSRPALIEQRKALFETDKADRLEKKNDDLAKIKADEVKRKEAKDTKDADYKERMADAKDEQNRIMMARVAGALSKVGSGEKNTDFDKKVKLLNEAGASKQDIANFITEKKQPSLEDLANGFMTADPMVGTKKAMQPSGAYEKARTLRALTSTNPPAPSPAPTAKPDKTASAPTPSRASQFKVIR